jgi:hypothetical protein
LSFYPCSIRKNKHNKVVMGPDHQRFVPHELGSSWTWIRWIRGCSSCSLDLPSSSRSILLHIFYTSPFNASLSLFALTLVIGPIDTSNRLMAWLRFVFGWFSSISINYEWVICRKYFQFYGLLQTIHKRVSFIVVLSTSMSMLGRLKSSFGLALFRYLKIHTYSLKVFDHF